MKYKLNFSYVFQFGSNIENLVDLICYLIFFYEVHYLT